MTGMEKKLDIIASQVQDYKDAGREYMIVWNTNKAIGVYDTLDEDEQDLYQVSLLTHICNKFDTDATLLEHYIAGIFTLEDIETALKNADIASDANDPFAEGGCNNPNAEPDMFESCPNYCSII